LDSNALRNMPDGVLFTDWIKQLGVSKSTGQVFTIGVMQTAGG